jgi:thioredoxin reductase
MAVDTPARIAILGAGPIGLEAALYARFLGYEVTLYERGRVAEHVLRWGHVRMFTPWQWNVSPLGVAALRAQHPGWQPPADDLLITGRQWAEAYLLPLAASDLLADSIQTDAQVVALARRGLLKGDPVDQEERGERDLVVSVRNVRGGERIDKADVVIDATGTYGRPNPLGPSGLPAIGQELLAGEIESGLPDIAGAQRERYAGRSVLVVGAGHSAATNVLALAALEPPAHVTWVTRKPPDEGPMGPVALVPGDTLPERDCLARSANALARSDGGAVRHWPSTWVKRIERADGIFRVQLIGEHKQEIEVERIIANVGHRPDHALSAELHMAWCESTDAPRNLAANPGGGPERLLNPEPDYYVLGAKSSGRRSSFLFSDGLRQIRDLFAIIGDRANLDLYGTLNRPG